MPNPISTDSHKAHSSPGTRLDRSALLTAAPASAIAFICCVLPLLWMLAAIIANPDVRSELKMTQFRAALLERTLLYNGAAAVIATIMGLPAGLVLGRGRGFFAKLLWVILPAALLMPSLSYAYGWSQFVRLTRPFFRPMGITFIPGGNADIFRCIWSLAAWLWAVPAGLIGLALRRLDANVQQQALLDGALYRVTFRQLLGPIIASLAVVTVLATQEFAVYEPTGISVVATEVRMVFDTGAMSSPDNSIAGTVSQGSGARSPDQPARAAAAVATDLPLLCITIFLSLLAIVAATRATASEAVTVGPWPKALDAPFWVSVVAAVLVLLNIGLPVWSLFASLRERFSVPYMWTEFGPQVQGAMIVAAIAATVAGVAAFFRCGAMDPGPDRPCRSYLPRRWSASRDRADSNLQSFLARLGVQCVAGAGDCLCGAIRLAGAGGGSGDVDSALERAARYGFHRRRIYFSNCGIGRLATSVADAAGGWAARWRAFAHRGSRHRAVISAKSSGADSDADDVGAHGAIRSDDRGVVAYDDYGVGAGSLCPLALLDRVAWQMENRW